IDPRGKLPTAIAGGAELDREVFELGGQHSDEVPDGHRTKNNTVTGGPRRPSYQHQLFGRNTMRLFGFLVAILVAQAFVAGPALAQARGRAFSGASSPTMVSPGVSSSMTGGIPGTLGSAPFNSGGSTTGAIGSPSTQGTSTTGSTDLLGTSVLG